METEPMAHHEGAEPAMRGWTPEQTLEQLRQHHESPDLVAAFEATVRVAAKVREQGGRSFLVGGAVRDELLGIPPHDLDLELHGLTQAQVEDLLEPFGSTDMTGKSFGTYKFRVGAVEVQIALPRRDSKINDTHRGFDVDIIPDLGIAESARRRDFTIGAMLKDVETGEIFDPFNGREDLAARTLRVVDEQTFGEDALRVLRGARFAAKFELTAEPKTLEIMRTMIEHIGALPKERLREEWLRLLTEAEHPSHGISLLHEIGLLKRWHPELATLWETPQDTRFHPEGDAGKHTMMVVDAAANLIRQNGLSATDKQDIMLGALTHDIGKSLATTQDDEGIHSYNHEAAGVKPAEIFLSQIGVPAARFGRITTFVSEHMRPAQLYSNRDHITDRALRKIVHDVGPHNIRPLILVAEADHMGRGPFVTADGEKKYPDTTQYHAWWEEQITRLALDTPREPLLWGRDLVERGWNPGPHIGEVLRLTDELAVQGMQREELLRLLDAVPESEQFIQSLRELQTS